MGVCTFALDADGFSFADANIGFRIRGKVTMSSSYATGGDTITAATVGLGRIRKAELSSGSLTGTTTQSYLCQAVYDSSGVNVTGIQAYWSNTSGNPFSEVSNATNLSTLVIDATFSGD